MDDVIIEELDEEIYIKKEIKKEPVKEKNMRKNSKNQVKKRKNNKRNKKIKILNICLLIISIIWLVMISINTFLIFKYDVLPFKFLIIYLILVVFLPILLIVLGFKNTIKKILKTLVLVIGVLYIVVLSFSFYYLNKTFSFLDDFTSGYNYETKNYMILVLKDSDYDDIKDLKDVKIGYVNQTDDYKEAIEKISSQISIKSEEFKDYTIMLKTLDNLEIDCILLTDVYFDMLGEEIEEFAVKYKVIHEFSLTDKIEEIKKEVDVTSDAFNIYITGIDSYGSVNSLTRSDVNIVASVNPRTNQILLINIPRDYYVELSGIGKKDKLTHASMYGVDVSIKTIEELLGIEVNYYLRVNYSALVNLVDALGGVDVYSKYSFHSTELWYSFKKGYNHVNGKQALEFVRTRKAFQDGDRVRGENQQAMIQALIKKIASPVILTKYGEILDSLKGSFTTNFGVDNITSLVKMQLTTMPDWKITSISLNGSDGLDYTYTYPYQQLYVMIPNQETILDAKSKLETVKNGKNFE